MAPLTANEAAAAHRQALARPGRTSRRRPRITRPTPLPAPLQLRDVLTDTLSRDVELVPAGNPLRTAGSTLIGTYADDDRRTVAIVAMEAPLAARVAGALALVTPQLIEERLVSGGLWGQQFDDICEVFNILAVLFNTDGAPHVRLSTVYETLRTFPPMDVVAWLAGDRPRVDVDVTVKGYGGGTVAVVVGGA